MTSKILSKIQKGSKMKEDTIRTKFLKFVKVKIRSFDNLNDDFSNALYVVNDAYLIRDASILKDPLVSYKEEKRILDAIEDFDITEKVIHHSTINGFKIARFIKVSKVYNTFSDSTILEFVRLVKKLNKAKVENLSTFSITEALEKYKSKIPETDYINKTKEAKLLKALAQDNLPKVISQSNVEKIKLKILENKLKLCDFRYGCLNSPFFDLAYFSNSFELDEKQDEYLLNKYFGYKIKVKYSKLLKHYKKYINLLRYYRYCYYFAMSGEITYLDLKNQLKLKLTNI